MTEEPITQIALFTDIHGLLEPLQAILLDIKKRRIPIIYSLGDNIGIGPNSVEVLDLLKANHVQSLKGNYEEVMLYTPAIFQKYYNELKRKDYAFHAQKLTQEHMKWLATWPHSIEIMGPSYCLALCHFPNDVRFDFLYHNSYLYMDKITHGHNGYPIFSYTNSLMQWLYVAKKLGMNVTTHTYNLQEIYQDIKNYVYKTREQFQEKTALMGYLSAVKDPLFYHQGILKTVYDYQAIIFGHTHFEVFEKDKQTTFYSLRGAGLGFANHEDLQQAKYYILNLYRKTFALEKIYVPYDRERMKAQVVAAANSNPLILKYTRFNS